MKNPLPPIVTEALVLGIWAASAVQVGGYTWQSIKSTWSQLPGQQGGSGGSPLSPTAVANTAAAGGPNSTFPGAGPNNAFFTTVRGVARLVGVAGTRNTATVTWPKQLTTDLPAALKSGNRTAALTAWHSAIDQMNKQGGKGLNGKGEIAAALWVSQQGFLGTRLRSVTGINIHTILGK